MGEKFSAQVFVNLKEGVLDPQGRAVLGGLHSLGFKDVTDVRVGKLITVKLKAQNAKDAQQAVADMSDKLLANPVIESFKVEVVEE